MEFQRKFVGYDSKEVNRYISAMTAEFNRLSRELKVLESEKEKLLARNQYFEQNAAVVAHALSEAIAFAKRLEAHEIDGTALEQTPFLTMVKSFETNPVTASAPPKKESAPQPEPTTQLPPKKPEQTSDFGMASTEKENEKPPQSEPKREESRVTEPQPAEAKPVVPNLAVSPPPKPQPPAQPLPPPVAAPSEQTPAVRKPPSLSLDEIDAIFQELLEPEQEGSRKTAKQSVS